jgi:hypothetical protein
LGRIGATLFPEVLDDYIGDEIDVFCGSASKPHAG